MDSVMPEHISYILSFLLDTEESVAADVIKHICYTTNKAEWRRYKIVIIPSGFFNKITYRSQNAVPQLPLPEIDGVPLLFGAPEVVRLGEQLVVKADIVASAYFLLTRYEELINAERDENGRFQGKSSILHRCGALRRPVVDEYGNLLRGWLEGVGIGLPERRSEYRKVISHDVDQIAQYRSNRGFAGGIKRLHITDALKSKLLGIENDPLFTFPWMRSKEKDIDTELFMKVAGMRFSQDLPYFDPLSADARKVLELYPHPGIHISYEASKNPRLIDDEVEFLSHITGEKITKSRHHYLASLNPSDFRYLINAGITDDFTMGYADEVGFRLGTSRPVKWIDPDTMEVTSLTLHPLIVMDRTLYDPRYMHLGFDDARKIVEDLQKITEKYGGEFVTLWHNSEVSTLSGSYARKLFEQICTK